MKPKPPAVVIYSQETNQDTITHGSTETWLGAGVIKKRATTILSATKLNAMFIIRTR